jgi:hypothetical protein
MCSTLFVDSAVVETPQLHKRLVLVIDLSAFHFRNDARPVPCKATCVCGSEILLHGSCNGLDALPRAVLGSADARAPQLGVRECDSAAADSRFAVSCGEAAPSIHHRTLRECALHGPTVVWTHRRPGSTPCGPAAANEWCTAQRVSC